jgi:DNA-binding transcriptional ArsR family regulator
MLEIVETHSVRKKVAAAATCEASCVHSERVAAARSAAVRPDLLSRTAELFKVFADPTRLAILSALSLPSPDGSASELCVCDLEAVLGMSQSAVSHQLAVLRAARLVRTRREGKTIHYSLADAHIGSILGTGLEHGSELEAGRAGGQQ